VNVAGLSPGGLLRLAREARGGDLPAGPVLVVGPLSAQLAKALAEGGDSALVRTAGDASSAGALVCVVGGAPTPEQNAQLRAATRAGVPTVAVQTGDPGTRVPYVLRSDVVVCRPGQGFPVREIADATVGGLGQDAAPLAARLPVLRPAAQHGNDEPQLPLLVLVQTRLLRSLAVASGRPAPSTQQEVGATVGPELGAALAVGLGARSLVRRLPVRNRLVDAAVAAGATFALATAATRLRPS
jgi:hypothetical protein